MSSEWVYFNIGDQCEKVTKGTTPTTIGGRFVESGINFVKVESISDEGQIHTEKLSAIDLRTDELLARSRIVKDDILFTIAGTIGRVCLVPEEILPANTNQAVAIIRLKTDSKLDRTYLYYALRSEVMKNSVAAGVVKAVQANFSLGNIKKLNVYAPKDISHQKQIAGYLKTLDDKIQLNTQTNQTLEQIAQAIFKSWFVDFAPVRAKMAALENGGTPEAALLAAMRAISAKDDAAMERMQRETPEAYARLEQTAALFPSAMEQSELGEVPEGWKIKSLSGMIELIGGGTPKRSEDAFWGGDIPWFSVKDAPADGDVFVIETEEKITELGLQKSSTKILPEGVTIISARGTVGRLALVGVPMAMNQSCYGVKGIAPAFNYFTLKQAVSTLQRQTHGAVFDTITTKTFETVFATHPSKNVIDKFERVVEPMLENIKNHLFESVALAQSRDSLLPKLLSGDISVTEVENVEGSCTQMEVQKNRIESAFLKQTVLKESFDADM